jgi:hypothetical protein
MERITRSFAVVVAIGAAALLSLGIAGTAMASASQTARQPQGVHAVPQQPTVSATSAVGTWHNYKDSVGDEDVTFTLSSNGRATFSTGCAGNWSQVASSVGIALAPSTCADALWELTGTLKNGGHLLSGKGSFIEGSVLEPFTWSATR